MTDSPTAADMPEALSDEELARVQRRADNTRNGNFMPGDMGAATKMLLTVRDDRERLLATIASDRAEIARLKANQRTPGAAEVCERCGVQWDGRADWQSQIRPWECADQRCPITAGGEGRT